MEAVEKQVVLGGQEVGEEPVEYLAGVVVRRRPGDGNGGELHQVLAEDVVLPEVVPELGDVQAPIAHLQDEGMGDHRLPLVVVLGAEVVYEWHGCS